MVQRLQKHMQGGQLYIRIGCNMGADASLFGSRIFLKAGVQNRAGRAFAGAYGKMSFLNPTVAAMLLK